MHITRLIPRDRAGARGGQPNASADALDAMRVLNERYIAAVCTGDHAWFSEHLADGALLVLADGRRLDKPGFVAMLRDEPRRFRSLEARDVTVRAFGVTVQVDADAPWELADGSTGLSRYIDTWAWLEGRWQVISAQVTPLPGSTPA